MITSEYVLFSFIQRLLETNRSQILVDGPSKSAGVPRHSASVAHILLTPIVIKDLPRGIRASALLKKWEEEGVEKQWKESPAARARVQTERRRELTDFERFKVMILKKQVSADDVIGPSESRFVHCAVPRRIERECFALCSP